MRLVARCHPLREPLRSDAMRTRVRTEAGQFDRARALVAELVEKSDRYGLDYLYWQLLGKTEQPMVEGRALLAARDLDSAAVAASFIP